MLYFWRSYPLVITFILLCAICCQGQAIAWEVYEGSIVNGLSNDQEIADITTDSFGNVYITGSCEFLSRIGTDTLNPANNSIHGFIAKYTSSGQHEWTRSIEGTGQYIGQEIATDINGDLYMAGLVGGVSGGSFSLDSILISNPSNTAFLLSKWSPDGTLLWYKLFDSPFVSSNNFCSGLATNPNGDVYFAGRYNRSINIDTLTLSTAFNVVDQGLFLARLDGSGNLTWVENIEGLNTGLFISLRSGDISLGENGQVYLSSFFDSLRVDSITYAANHKNLALFRFTEDGQLVWLHRVGLPGLSSVNTMEHDIVYNEGFLYFIGSQKTFNNQVNPLYFDTIIIDTLLSPSPFFGRVDSSGNLGFVDVVNEQITSGNTLKSLAAKAGQVMISGIGNTEVQLGNVYQSLGSTFENSFGIAYSPGLNNYDISFVATAQQVQVAITTAHYDLNGDLIIGGQLEGLASLDTLSIGANLDQELCLFKRIDCSYLSPAVSLDPGDSVICGNAEASLSLTGFSNGLGIQWLFSGNPIPSATFPSYSALIPGSYSVKVTDSVCNATSAPVTISSGSSVPVSFTPNQTQFCASDSAVLLSGGNPSGGVFFGTGVSNGVFDPSISGAGNFDVFYVYDQGNGCIDSVSQTFSVLNAPGAFFFPAFDSVCLGIATTLNSGFPIGGVYSGSGVSGNTFLSDSAGVGHHTLYYLNTNGSCSSVDSIQVTVVDTPMVSLNLSVTETCENGATITLSGGTPAGGMYSGSGVSGGFFLPGIVDPGTKSISYSITEGGCTATAIDHISVDSFPQLSLPVLDSVCLGSTALSLHHASPGSGVYSGIGISSNIFNASIAGLGMHPIEYVFTNSCASDTANSTIQVIGDPTISASVQDVACNGSNDGNISVSVAGGAGPYGYSWSSGDTTNSTAQLTAQTYSVTVTGLNGCVAEGSYVVDEPASLETTLDSLDDVVCNGFSNGKAYTSTSGGTAPYSFQWSNGSVLANPIDLSVGSHQLVVTDSEACSDTLQIEVMEVAPVSINATSINVTCNGAQDGIAAVSALGGTGAYAYQWSNGATQDSVPGLDTGWYQVTVTDGNSCSTTDSVLILEPDSLTTDFVVTNVSCFGEASGTIQTSVTGGNEGYTYQWSNGASDDSLYALVSGTYTLTLSDAKSCTRVDSALVEQPDSLTIQITALSNLLCHGDSTASFQASIAGGTSPYALTWNTGASVSTLNQMPAGTYTASVSDSNGCINQQSYLLTEPDPLLIGFDTILNPICHSESNGLVGASGNGGTLPYSFSWSNGVQQSLNVGLDSGAYALTVTDGNGCASDTSIVLNHPPALSAAFSITDVACAGDSSGSILTTTSNAQGSEDYLWSNGSVAANPGNIPADIYMVTITDSVGCELIESVIVNEPDSLGLEILANLNLCFGDSSGSLQASVAGGILPYSYAWSNGASSSQNLNLPAGTYTLIVTDSNGCFQEESLVLNQPPQLQITVDSIEHILCFDDSSGYIGISANGGSGTPLFQWNDGFGGSVYSNIPAATYTIIATDTNMCSADTTLTLTEPLPLTLSLDSAENNPCFGDSSGTIYTSTSGGTGNLNFLWNTAQTGTSLQQLAAGSYELTVTDENGCTDSLSYNLTQPDELLNSSTVVHTNCDNTADGSISVQTVGGISPFEYDWNDGSSAASIDMLGSGVYVLTTTDSAGCFRVDSFNLGFDHLAPVVQLGNDTVFCSGDTFLLSAAPGLSSYSWSTGATSQSIQVNIAGTYSLSAADTAGCENSDTIAIIEHALPVFDLGNDTLLCQDSLEAGFEIQGPLDMNLYEWNTGSMISSESITQFGLYTLMVEDSNACRWSDSIAVTQDTCLGHPEKADQAPIILYPNPNRGRFTLSNLGRDAWSFNIYNKSGQIVHQLQTRSSQEEIDLTGQPAGVYSIIGRQQNRQVTFRMVIL